MNESTATMVVLCVLILSACVLGIHGCSQMEQTERAAMEAGLVQVQAPTTTTMVWTKP